jgi:SAM-dependent methyltransferase
MHDLQEAVHGDGHDYITGSPHLQHAHLNAWMRAVLNEVVNDLADRAGRAPRVLEVGAGHGPFTETLVSAGAEVVVTEMSAPSAALLRERFRHSAAVSVRHDPDGNLDGVGPVDLVVYMSVLHHIPDYLASLTAAARTLRPGGAIVTFQDPLWYPRRPRSSVVISRAVQLAWRLSQGELARGLATQVRRVLGVYDETSPSDMSEYHVVRDGVDEQAIAALLGGLFDRVEVLPYWSSQAAWAQALGARFGAPNTFGVVATGRR